MKIYGTYKQRFIQDGNFTDDVSLNGYYDLSFFLAYPAYQLPTLTVKDGIKTNLDYIFIAEYDEIIINQANIDLYLASIPTEFNIQIKTIDEMIAYIKANTGFIEETPGKFLISPGYEFAGQIIPANYLVIN